MANLLLRSNLNPCVVPNRIVRHEGRHTDSSIPTGGQNPLLHSDEIIVGHTADM